MKQFLSFDETIRVRMLLKFFTVLAHTMVMPYTVVYFAAKIGASLTTTMIIIIGFISIIGYLLGGQAADRFGRKRVIITSELMTGFGFLIVCCFDSLHHFYAIPIVIAFSFIYFFESASNPAYSALIIDASNEKDRKIIYTYFMWISSTAFAGGSLLGGFFFENHSSMLFFIVGLTSILSAVLTSLLIKDIPLKAAEAITELPAAPAKKLSIFASQLFLFLCIGQLLINILKEQFPNYLSIRIVSKYPLGDFDVSGYKMIGYLNLEETIIITIAAGVIFKLTKRLSEKTSLMLGLLLFILGYICLSYFIHPAFLMLGMLFISVGGLIYLPTLQAITAKSLPAHSRGKHLSVLGLVGAVGGMISSLFIWGMESIPEIGITFIFIVMGIFLVGVYWRVYHISEDTHELQFKMTKVG
ncbi:MFS transporter [Bacillus infantis]|uniref:MFS transporter n=1 Tax=Bacillus infantis TaxID=324767 RepID=A0A5D4QS92_9BACI|nr:MFS transporter [Bacillus infantis]TYS41905.1 MFS transporter [Bacillus infantis]